MFLITSHYIIYLYFCFLYCYNPLLMLANIWCPPIFFHPKNGTFTLGNGTVKQKFMNSIIMHVYKFACNCTILFLFSNMNASFNVCKFPWCQTFLLSRSLLCNKSTRPCFPYVHFVAFWILSLLEDKLMAWLVSHHQFFFTCSSFLARYVGRGFQF